MKVNIFNSVLRRIFDNNCWHNPELYCAISIDGCFLLCRCNYILDCDGKPKPFTVEDQEKIVKNVIEPMAGDGLRTICMAYKDYHTDTSKSSQTAGACCSVKDLRIYNIVVRPVGILD